MDNTVKGFQTNEGTKQYDYNALANLPTLISQDNIDGAIANALEQAKQNGDFKGEPGDDYILTEDDKNEIARLAADLIDIPESGGGSIDLTGYATQNWVSTNYQPKGNYLTSVPSGYAKTEDIPTDSHINGLIDAKFAQFTNVAEVGA